MTGAEHRAKAVEYLARAEAARPDVWPVAWVQLQLLKAQVHATLALSANDSDPASGEEPS